MTVEQLSHRYREDFKMFETILKWDCGHIRAILSTSEKPVQTDTCPACQEKAQKAEAAKLARKQARMIKVREEDEWNDKFPEYYTVSFSVGKHKMICDYLGKEPGLEAVIEKHWRKRGNHPYYLATGHYVFHGVNHETEAA